MKLSVVLIEGAGDADVALVEIGGTVGDIESLPFMEAVRQLKAELGSSACNVYALDLSSLYCHSG